MNGLHVTADLYECRAPAALMTNADRLGVLCRSAIEEAGLTLVAEKWHAFPDHEGSPGGLTGALLLAESHVAVHTWPERGGVTLDVYVCNFSQDNSDRARNVLDTLAIVFRPLRSQRQELQRGDDTGTAGEAGIRLESLSADTVYGFRFARRLLWRSTPFQQLELLESAQLGRTLLLDGHFMTSERDEFFYHEALVHPAAIAHPSPRRVLLAGGGDGGAAEELLKHPSVERVVLVDLDPAVVEVARRHLHAIHRGSLDDRRVTVHCADAAAFVGETAEQFDLVLLDLTDPETPAGPLYTAAFFERLRRVLAPGGAVVLHLGAPFFEPEQVRALALALQRCYANVSCYGLHIPLYGAYWAFAVASDRLEPPTLPAAEVQARLDARGIRDLRYYNAPVHGALFALPTFYRELVQP
jgi:spermidine synthase